MSNSINTNIAAFYAQANITAASNQATSSVARLSSGNAIVQASDNVAALAIGNSINSEVAQLNTASTNSAQGNSLLQVADGALAQIGSILNQQNSIALQAASGSLTNTDRGFLNQQFQALTNEINALSTGTTFNGVQLLDGSIAPGGASDSLQNASIGGLTTQTTAITNAGFAPTTNGPQYGTVNFNGFANLSGTSNGGLTTNAQTQYTGFVASGNIGASTVINGPTGANDPNLQGSLAVTGNTTLAVTLDTGSNYAISYTIGGVNYTGVLVSAAADGSTTANETVTLTSATSGTGTIQFDFTGAYASGDHHAAVGTAITNDLASATGYNPFFVQTPVITQPQGGNDQSLYGALIGGTANGSFNVSYAGTVGTSGTGYNVTYTINNVQYQGHLADTSSNDSGIVAAGTSVTLTALTNSASHATITLTTGATAFGTATGDQSNNIQTSLTNQFTAATGYSAGFVAPSTTNSGLVVKQATGTSSIDSALTGDLSNGTFSVVANGSIAASGGTATAYTIGYTINNVTYQGTLTTTGTGIVAANAALTLTATTNSTLHDTLHLVTGSQPFGIAYGDQTPNITAALKAFFTGASVLTAGNSTTVAGTVTTTGLTLVGTQNDIGKTDTALDGALSGGVFTVTGGASTSYNISYLVNGSTYTGTLTAAGVTNGAQIALDNGSGKIILNIGTTDTQTDTAGHLQTQLNTFLGSATGYASQNNQNATVTGQVAQSGIGLVSSQNDVNKNDTAFVGDLSKGVFTVTGNTSNGYAVSYALNGSTYQGSLTAAELTNGSTLVLDNGKGSLAFAITASSTATPNTSTASASALQTGLTAQFAGATSSARHEVLIASATDTNGVAIAGSAIPAVTTGVLTGFSGSNVTLQSSNFSGVNLPSVSAFSGTGSGTSTVLSVNINGTSYSTAGTVTNGSSTLQTATFNGNQAGVVTFYAGGDTSSNQQLTLNLSAVTGAANINTSADVTNLVDSLNTAFGSGGSGGGLQFQLGTTSGSNVTVNIGSARSTALFNGLSLDISTQTGATAAAAQVNTAINTVTALRAGVGALESQFNFASAALQSSVQNQQAAAGQFLDTNIASESTKFAGEQVKLQAGISVLAQANQQLQALLKLIG